MIEYGYGNNNVRGSRECRPVYKIYSQAFSRRHYKRKASENQFKQIYLASRPEVPSKVYENPTQARQTKEKYCLINRPKYGILNLVRRKIDGKR